MLPLNLSSTSHRSAYFDMKTQWIQAKRKLLMRISTSTARQWENRSSSSPLPAASAQLVKPKVPPLARQPIGLKELNHVKWVWHCHIGFVWEAGSLACFWWSGASGRLEGEARSCKPVPCPCSHSRADVSQKRVLSGHLSYVTSNSPASPRLKFRRPGKKASELIWNI